MSYFLWLLPTIFWIWAIIDCLTNDPERNTWIWLLIFLHFPGAVIYFIVRRLPNLNLPIPNYFSRWTRRQELWNAEAAAINIGKAHQFVLLGNLLYDLDRLERAENAYETALEKEPDNDQALWGAAQVAMRHNNFAKAKTHLETLLKIDREYKQGDASLAYIKTLLALQETDTAQEQLEEHLKYWRKSEAYFLLAEILAKKGQRKEARNHVETMLRNLQGSPSYYYRKHQHLVRKGRKLLKTLSA